MPSALVRWLVARRLPLYLAVLAVVLSLPALWVDWQLDDHFHRLIMVGSPEFDPQPLNVFATLRGDPEKIRTFIDAGLFPWWTPSTYRLSFFRYLSAISMWIDYLLWPEIPALMHLHSLLWLAAAVVVAAVLYRRLLGASWCAGLAALLYAVDEAHVMPASWLANRNALLATVFGLLCLTMYDRWRREGLRTAAVLSPVFLGLALCSGEMALATAGYLLAYAAFLDPAPRRRKLTALTANACVLVVWAVVYRAFGFGTFGSDFYHDPLGPPPEFFGGLVERVPMLLLGQWSPVAADWAAVLPEEAFRGFWLAGVTVMLVVAVFLWPLVRKDRVARFWLAGMLLSLVPIAAVMPANRLLCFVGLGAMGLLAQLVYGIVEGGVWLPRSRAWRLSAYGFVGVQLVFHLVLAPLFTPVLAYSLKPLGEPMIRVIEGVPDDPAIAEQDLVLVNPPDYLYSVSSITTLKILQRKPYPRRRRVLVTGSSPLEVTRVGPRALRIKAEEGIYGGILGRLFRSRRNPMFEGQAFELTGLTVEIIRIDPRGDPIEIVFTFAVPLEDPSLRWLRWEEDGYVPFDPPLIGEPVTLPPSYGPMDVFRR